MNTQVLDPVAGSGTTSRESEGVSLRRCCERIGISVRTGERLIAEGKFPIPELPRLTPRAHHRFSTADIDLYLERAATSDVRRRG